MKKRLLLLVTIILFSFSINSQTIVSTSPENKNVILEEFTGIHCTYCPDGHAIAQGIQDANPGDVFLINIHEGGYATPGSGEPDFRTIFGTAIAGQSGLTGYPAGTVNRHLFPGHQQGSGTAQSRGSWGTTSTQILGESSYVNVAVEADIDVVSRELTVHVEAYYTGDSPEATNYLNVALLQNNTFGPQVGGGAGDQYIHMHRLVWMITDQWGEEITTTTNGTFVDKTYTYTLPADYIGVDVVIPDMEIVAFMTETTQEVSSGSGCTPTYTFTNDNDVSVSEVLTDETSCGAPISPFVSVNNNGNNEITSLSFDYSINGGTVETYTWTGNIAVFGSETIELPAIAFALEASNTVNVTIQDDENNANNSGSTIFGVAPESGHLISLLLNSGSNGAGCTWNIIDLDDNVLYSGGPYENSTTVNETFLLAPNCYEFNVMNSYGEGGGSISLKDAEENIIYYSDGQYEYGDNQAFSSVYSAPVVSFFPEHETVNVPRNSDITLNFNETVRMINDDLITDPASFISIITVPGLQTIDFTASINSENDVITITPDGNLPGDKFIKVSIDGSSIENIYDVELESASATFKTEESNNINNIAAEFNIFPNPAKNTVSISNAKNSVVTFIDIYGKSVLKADISSNSEDIDIKELASGLYILNIDNNGYRSERKLIITK